MYKTVSIIMASLLFSSCANSPATRGNGGSTYATRDVELVDDNIQTYPRIALVIGNNDYEKNRILTNAVPDARAMRDFFIKKGFRVVYAENANKDTMKSKVNEFMNGLGKKSISVVYYSGHATEDRSKENGKITNYLLPTNDTTLISITDYDRDAISMNYIVSKADDINHGLNIAMLDACRTSIGKGNGSFENIKAEGIYLVYSTDSGVTASDSGEFRKSFLKYADSSMKLNDIFLGVKRDLIKTGQKPIIQDKTNGEIFFFTRPPKPTPTPVVKPQPVAIPIVSSFPTPKMVHISKGSFTMGSNNGDSDEKPPHRVTINYDFEIGKYEVSVGEFRAFVNDTGYETEAQKGDGCYVYNGTKWAKDANSNWKNLGFPQNENHPVACVSWNDSKAYTKWLSGKTGQNYRLPTEAEWEFVARAGSQTKWSFGDNKSDLKNYGNIADSSTNFSWKESWSDGYKNTAPIGSFRANQKGVNDMHGNVWEWCEDWYLDGYNSTPKDGSANHSQNKNKKVLRGGSWFNLAHNARSSIRSRSIPAYRYYSVGFRLQRTLP